MLLGNRTENRQFTSVSLAVIVSIPGFLLLPIFFFFGGGIDPMLPPIPLSLPTAFPKLLTHTPRVGRSLYPSRSVMSGKGRPIGKGSPWKEAFPSISGYSHKQCVLSNASPGAKGLYMARTQAFKLHHPLHFLDAFEFSPQIFTNSYPPPV